MSQQKEKNEKGGCTKIEILPTPIVGQGNIVVRTKSAYNPKISAFNRL
jgi:hypothetical protein